MGFFDDVGDWISGAANTVGDGLKDLYNDVIKPASTTVWNGGVSIVNRAVNFGEKAGNIGLNFAERTGNSVSNFGDLLSNPFLIIGGLIVAAIVLPKLLDKKIR